MKNSKGYRNKFASVSVHNMGAIAMKKARNWLDGLARELKCAVVLFLCAVTTREMTVENVV